MKKFFFFSAILISHSLMAQNVGIGITNPLYKLHVGTGAMRIEGFASAGSIFPSFSIGAYGNVYIDATGGFPGGRMTILENGNIGIGTSYPGHPLNFSDNLGDKISLWGNSSLTYGLGIQTSLLQIHTDESAADIAFGYGSSTAFTETMRIKGTGNVGIGTSTPLKKLHVEGATFLNGNVGIGIMNPNAPLGFAAALGKKITLYPGAVGDAGLSVQLNLLQIYSNSSAADIAFGYDLGGTMTERMRIKGNGNVGIGTTDPNAKLHISASDASLALFGPNSYGGQLYVGAGSNQNLSFTAQVLSSDGNLHLDPAPGKNIYLGYYQARDIYLNPNGGNIGIGGNVGIGTNTPGFPLNFAQVTGDKISLYGNSGAHYGFGVQGYLMQIHTPEAAADIAFGYGSSNSFTETMRIKGTGKVGIGTISPATTFEVNGYSKLGSDAPSIKVKKLTGTTAATEGGSVLIAVGLDVSKIISVTVIVFDSFSAWYEPNTAGFGNNFYWDISQGLGAVRVSNRTGDSVYILSRPIKVLITYEE